jgi:mRNA interferase MazF
MIEPPSVQERPARVAPQIKSAPKIRELYWCDFWKDVILPEMWKRRPALVVSYKNALHGHCLILPISTDPQLGANAKWAHKLSVNLDRGRDSWVICNHPYTVSTARLQPLSGSAVPRLAEPEFNLVLAKLMEWLPKLP